jgi:hypothetical protein
MIIVHADLILSLDICLAAPCAGANKWPGANLVVQDSGAKFVLKYQDRTRWVEKLKVCFSTPSCVSIRSYDVAHGRLWALLPLRTA